MRTVLSALMALAFSFSANTFGSALPTALNVARVAHFNKEVDVHTTIPAGVQVSFMGRQWKNKTGVACKVTVFSDQTSFKARCGAMKAVFGSLKNMKGLITFTEEQE